MIAHNDPDLMRGFLRWLATASKPTGYPPVVRSTKIPTDPTDEEVAR